MTERTYAYIASDTDGDLRMMKSANGFENYFESDPLDDIIIMTDAVNGLIEADKPAVYRISIHIEKVFEIP